MIIWIKAYNTFFKGTVNEGGIESEQNSYLFNYILLLNNNLVKLGIRNYLWSK